MPKTLQEIFQPGWPRGGDESEGGTECGPGSLPKNTARLRRMFPAIMHTVALGTGHKRPSVGDAGCGDLAWIRGLVPSDQYRGYDVCERRNWGDLRGQGWRLYQEDMRHGIDPADLIVCRDVLLHLPNPMVLEAIDVFKGAGLWLAANTNKDSVRHPVDNFNRLEEPSLEHSLLDLRLAPFNLGEPEMYVSDEYEDKGFALWRLNAPTKAVVCEPTITGGQTT